MTGVIKTLCAALSWMTAVASVVQAVHADTQSYLSFDGRRAPLPVVQSFASVCAEPDEMTLAAIVPVATDHGSHASGIVFDDNRVLTAAHAVQGAGHFFVRVGDSFRVADLVMVDHANDLAVLAVNTSVIAPLRISAFSPSLSAPVWAVGYPRAQSRTTSEGIFQQASDGSLYTSASIDSGQSGGGLLSCAHGRWSLVGMLRGYGAYLQGDQYVKLENHSVSVAADTIQEFLRSYQ